MSDDNPDYIPPVVRLRKSLYRLPMASAKFRAHSDDTLIKMGFKPTIYDSRIYVKFMKMKKRIDL